MKNSTRTNFQFLLNLCCLLAFATISFGQNAIVGTGFSSGWGGACGSNSNFSYFSLITGSGSTGSYGSTLTANGTGNQYWRFGVDWSGTIKQLHLNTSGTDVQVSPNTTYTLNSTCVTSGAMFYNVPNVAYNYVFKTQDAGSSPAGNWVFFEVQGAVQTVSSVSNATPIVNQATTVTATLSGALNAGQGVYLRCTNNAFSTSTVVQMTGSGTTYTASVPASVNTSGSTVSYYVFTSGTANVASNGSNADFYTINLNNNSGTNYSYTLTSNPITVVSTGGTAFATYTTFSSALSAINSGTHTGTITCYVNAGHTETAPVSGFSITATGTLANPITFVKSGSGTNPTFTAFTPQTSASQSDAIIKIVGGDYITIDGFTLQENASNTTATLSSNNMTEAGVALYLASATNGAQNNTIQNCTITLGSTYQNAIGILSTSSSSSTNGTLAASATTGTNSNNKFYGNTISGVAYGLYFICEPLTSTIFETGNDVGGTTVAQGNTITFGNVTTANYSTLARFTSTSPSGILFRNGAGNSVRYNSITSNSLAYPQSVGVLGVYMVGGGTTPSGVTYTSTISNNTIVLTNTGTTPMTGIEFGAGISTGTIVGSNNTITLNQTAGAANSSAIIGIRANYSSATNTCSGNTLTFNQSSTTGALSSATTGITLAGAGTTLTASTNNITINQTGSGTATITGNLIPINVSGASTTNNVQGNTVVVNQTTSVASGISNAITGVSATAAASSNLNIGGTGVGESNTITVKQAFTASGTYSTGAVTYVDLGSAAHGNVNVRNNTFNTTGSTLRATGAMNCVSLGSGTLTGLLTVKGNTATIDRVATAGNVGFFTQTSTSPNDPADTISNNIITFSSLATSGTVTVINRLGGLSTANRNINLNNISVSGTNTGTVTGIVYGYSSVGNAKGNTITVSCAAATMTGISANSNTTLNTMSNNTISLSSSATSPTAITGLSIAGAGAHSITANTFSALNFTGIITGSPTVSAIAIAGGTAANVFSNTIANMSVGAATSTASPILDGILVSGGTSINVYKNKISGLTTASTGTSTTVNGIRISAGATNNIYNNLIGNLTATAAASTDALRGISITSTTASSTHNVYYNTVYLNGSSSGANFGSSGIFHTTSGTSTTSALNLRNNVIVNTSTPAGTGLTVAFRRSSGAASALANYASTSNNNIFYAGTPGSSRLIYSDGTSTAQTMAAYKAGVFTAGTIAPRDAGSFSESPTFVSTTGSDATFLHLSTSVATQAESGGTAISGFTDDFDGDTRHASTPDIGADEFAGVAADLTAPTITYTALTATCSTADRTLSGVSISDATGVPTSGGLMPRIYYKKNSGSYFSQAGTLTAGTGTSGTWSFNIVASDMGGLAAADVVSYFVIAQDAAPSNNITSSPATGLIATDVNTVTTPPTTPSTYTISATLSGTYTVGSGGNYSTLTAAAAAYNSSCLSGAVVFSLTDASYGSETYPITFNSNSDASATNNLTIRPATGISPVFVGSNTTGLLLFNGADYITLDGTNNPGDNVLCPASSTRSRDLHLINTNAAGQTVVNLQTFSGNTVSNVTIKNCNIQGNTSTTTTYGIFSNGTTSNLRFENNRILKCSIGIGCSGASAGAKNTGTVIQQNYMVQSGSGNAISRAGIWLGFDDGATISGNVISNMSGASSADAVAIGLGLHSILTSTTTGNDVTNATVTKNLIDNVRGASTYSSGGIVLGSVTSGTTTIANNMINGVISNGTGSDFGVGIFICGGTGSTTRIYHNTINSTGTLTGGLQHNYCIAINGSDPTVDIRNNILVNSATNGTGSSYTIGLAYSTYTNLTSNNNSLYTSGSASQFTRTGGLGTGTGTNQTSLSAWQTATSKDANSVNILPTFTSATDLHLDINNTTNITNLNGTAAVTTTTDDIDCTTRHATTPDIGADEFTPVACSAAVGGTASATSTSFCVGATTTLSASGMSTGGGITYQWMVSATSGSGYANVSGGTGATSTSYTTPTSLAAGVYYYVLQVTCENGPITGLSTEVQITVNAAPTASIAATPSSSVICGTGNVVLTASPSGAATYAWSPSTGLSATNTESVTATPTASTTYTVTVTVAGCTGTATKTVTVAQAVSLSASATPSSVCSGGSSQLLATGSTTLAYNVTAASLAAVSTSGLTAGTFTTTPSGDDVVSNSVNIGFSFTFFGNTYTTFQISTNGNIQFGGSASDEWTPAAIPTAAVPNNYIALAWRDWTTVGSGEINYYTYGTAPNRSCLIYFNDAGNYVGQIVLHETTNTIDIISINIGTQTSVQGIENSTGTSGVAATGRNNVSWSSTSVSSYIFTPVGFTYAWSPATYLSAANIANPMATSIAGDISYVVTVTETSGCTATSTVAITAGSALSAAVSPSSATRCSNVAATLLTGVPTGGGSPFTYTWSPTAGLFTDAAATVAYDGSALASANIYAKPSGTTTYSLTINDACSQSANANVMVTVNTPAAVSIVHSPDPALICGSGSVSLTASGSSTYAWSPSTGLSGTTGATVTASPTATTTYIVTATDANGCTSTAQQIVTFALGVSATASATPNTLCPGSNSQLLATAGTTANYTVSSTTYGLITPVSPVTLTQSDETSATVTLPFQVEFFGNKYSTAYVHSNGFVSFSSGQPTGSPYLETVPATATPNNYIALCKDDLNVTGTGAAVTHFTSGTSPNRIWVVQFASVKFYNGGSNNGALNGQIQIFEADKRIEVHLTEVNDPTASAHQIGIENSGGTIGVAPAGRNNATFSVVSGSPEAWRFAPSGGTISYSWTENPSSPTTLAATNIANPMANNITLNKIYTVTAVDLTGCTATATASVSVHTSPDAGSITGTASACVGSTSQLANAVSGGVWASSNTGVATVDAAGLVTAVAAGSATISYTVTDGNSCTASATVSFTVNANPNAGTIAGTLSVCAGATAALSTNGDAGGTWASSNTSVATINTGGFVTSLVAGTSTISYTVTTSGCTSTATATFTVNAYPNAGTIAGTTALCVGATSQLTSNGAGGGTWSNSNGNAVSLDAAGLVTAIGAGTATITYTVTENGCASTATTTVVVTAYPNAGTISGTLAVCAGGSTTQLSSDGDSGGTWTSSSAAIATVNSSGLVTGVSAGSVTISYSLTSGGICTSTANSTVTVNALPSVAAISGTASVCVGSTTALTNSTSGGVWASSNSSVATVNSSGVVSGVSAGSATISYTVTDGNGCSASATISVSVNALPSVTAISGTASVCVGSTTSLSNSTSGGVWASSNSSVATVNSSGLVSGVSAGSATISYTVTDGNSCSASTTISVSVNALPSVAAISGTASVCVGSTTSLTNSTSGGVWASSNSSVATVNSSGVVSGVSAGSATISYTVTDGNGCSASATVSVSVNALPSVAAISGTASVCVGSTTSLTNSTSGGVWASSNSSVATVNSSGVVSGVSAGSATISYTVTDGNGCSASATVSVSVNALPSVAAISGTNSVCVGSTTSLTNSTSGGVWASSNSSVATVNSSGVVSGVSAGSATISYTVTDGNGCSASATVSVSVNALPSVAAISGTASVCVGSTTSLTNSTSGGVWASSNSSGATVNSSGVVSGVSAGSATISYTVTDGNSCSASATVSVSVNALPSVAAISGTASVCVGSTTSLSNSTSGGVWASSNSSVATVNSSGVVSGVSTGSATISYTVTDGNGCSASATVSVSVNALPSVAAISGTASVCVGSTTSLTNSTSGGVWASSNSSVATVNYSGVVSGVSAGSATISYTVTDGNGCSASATVSVLVNALPSVAAISGMASVCVGLTTSLSNSTSGGVWASSNSSVATVNSSGVVSGVSAGSATISYTVTDGNGCSASATVSVSVNALPSVAAISGTNSVCVGSTTSLSNSTSGGVWASSNSSVATVNSSGVVSGVSAGSATISYTVTDGNSCSASATVSVSVNALPNAGTLSGTSTISIGGTTQLSSNGDSGGTWASSNTSVATVNSTGLVSGVASGSTTISYTVTDGNGCSSSATLSISVDCTPASFTACPSAAVVVNTGSGVCTATATYTTTATGAPAPTVEYAFSGATTGSGSGTGSGSTFNKGNTTVTVTATGTCGAPATCVFTVTVNDNQAPVLACPANQNLNTASGICTASYTIADPVSDNCSATWAYSTSGATTLSASGIADGAGSGSLNFNLGTTVVTLSATDGTNSATTCSFEIVVSDNQAPTLACPANQNLNTASGICTAAYTIADPVSDNCTATWAYSTSGATTLSASGIADGTGSGSLNFNLGTTVVTLSATDGTNAATTCSFEIVVSDNQAPVLACPANQNLNTASGICTASYTIADPVSDNCTATWGYSTSGATTLSASGIGDGSGSGSLTFNLGTTVVTLSATDGTNAATTCSFEIVVSDNQAPVLTCPANQNLNTASGICTASYTIADPISDNCTATWGYSTSGATTLSASGISDGAGSGSLTFNLGTTVVTLSATDGTNSATTCSFSIVVSDNQAPVLTCPADQDFNSVTGFCSAPYTIADPIADNCSGATWSYSTSGATTLSASGIADGVGSGSLNFSVGTTTVTLSGTDGSNAATTCTFLVIVSDTEYPILACPANQNLNTASGICTAAYTIADPVSDNCTATWGYSTSGATTLSASGIADGSGSGSLTFNLGTTVVTLTATDGPNVAATCSFSIVVSDNQAPVLTCPANQNLNTASGICTAAATIADPVSDNCTATWGYSTSGTTSISAAGISDGSGSGSLTFNLGTTVVTLSATDGTNSAATCTFNVVVSDNQAPVLTCPANQNLNTAAGICTAAATIADPVSDNCTATWGYSTSGATTLSASGIGDGSGSGSLTFNLGTTVVTLSATDGTNSATTCTFNVVVSDNQAPVLTCPTNQNLNTAAGICTAAYTIADPVSDNCTATWGYSTSGATTLSASGIGDGSGSGSLTFNLGTTVVTLSATDGTNSATTCTFNVVVSDNQAPVLACPANQNLNTASGICTASYTIADPVSDNCTATWGYSTSGATSISAAGIADGTGSGSLTFNLGTTVVTLSATDGTNSAATCTFTIAVSDNTPPTVTCPANQSLNVAAGTCTQTYTVAAPTISDNCSGALTWHVAYSGNAIGNPAGQSNIASGSNAATRTFNRGATTVTLSATDAAGNNSTVNCTFTVSVVDNIAPVPTAASLAPVTETCIATLTVPTASDNCSGSFINGTTPQNPFTTVGTHTVVWTFTDASGNTATQTQSVTINCSGDGDGDGFTVENGDCDDTNAAIYPGAPETCNGVDDDCDGSTDEGSIAITFNIIPVTCFGNSNGTVFTTHTGGTAPFTYLWSNGKTTKNINLLAAGSYTLTVTSSTGCSGTATAVVTQPTAVGLVIQSATVVGGAYTVVTAASGGTPAYQFSRSTENIWRVSNSTPTPNNLYNYTALPAGTYIFRARDSKSCQKTIIYKLSPIPMAPMAPMGNSTQESEWMAIGRAEITETDLRLAAYPNPTSDVLNVAFITEEKTAGQLVVTDLVGRILHTQSVVLNSEETLQIPTSALPVGAYTLHFKEYSGKTNALRFVVERN